MTPQPARSATALTLTPRAASLARKGQLWFYADDVDPPLSADTAPSLVRLADHEGRDLGLALCSPRSKLCFRRCGRWPGEGVPSPAEFLRARLAAAIAARAALASPEGGVRLVHGEADELPGLVVDRFADCLVVQLGTAPLEAMCADLVEVLESLCAPRMILARNDLAVRRFEGLDQTVRLLSGRRVEELEIVEAGLRHPVRPFDGHKTGFYLDQAPARAYVRAHARGRRVLDAFAYQCGFALSALAGGARDALAIDESAPALERARATAAANGLGGLETVTANAFQHLRELRQAGRAFELVVVDPPAFAKSRRELEGGLRGYRDLNRLALRVLAPGGLMLTCSCSHHVSLPHFEDVLRQAAADLPFRVLLRARLGAGPDHPVAITAPESEYLKVLVVERAG
ncbi:MAG: class I SAM-dependent rRNA methyltransferase [Planctomycetes bacterium]|nr:class I SAM-dependent rRNA methyltransferase [Planctomycetota bacterium]